MALSPNLQLLALIAIGTWVLLIAIALIRLRSVPIESKTIEMPKLMILASSAAGAVTLIITVLAGVFFPDFMQDNSASLYTAGFLGAMVLVWWTFAVFWRETKLVSTQVSERPVAEMEEKKHRITKSRSSVDADTLMVDVNMLNILMALRHKGGLSSGELHKEANLSVSLPTFLSILTRLVEQALVCKMYGRDGVYYMLTPRGEELLD